MLTPKAHLLLHMDEVSAVVISRVKGRGEEVTWFAYTKPKFTAMASAEEKHWEAFANRTRNSTAPSAEGGARRRTTVCATAQHHRMRNSTGGTVEGARNEGKVEWPFKKETQNGLLTCSQCGGYIHNANSNGCRIEIWTVVTHAGNIATSPKQGLRSVLSAGTPVFFRLHALLRRSGTM